MGSNYPRGLYVKKRAARRNRAALIAIVVTPYCMKYYCWLAYSVFVLLFMIDSGLHPLSTFLCKVLHDLHIFLRVIRDIAVHTVRGNKIYRRVRLAHREKGQFVPA